MINKLNQLCSILNHNLLKDQPISKTKFNLLIQGENQADKNDLIESLRDFGVLPQLMTITDQKNNSATGCSLILCRALDEFSRRQYNIDDSVVVFTRSDEFYPKNIYHYIKQIQHHNAMKDDQYVFIANAPDYFNSDQNYPFDDSQIGLESLVRKVIERYTTQIRKLFPNAYFYLRARQRRLLLDQNILKTACNNLNDQVSQIILNVINDSPELLNVENDINQTIKDFFDGEIAFKTLLNRTETLINNRLTIIYRSLTDTLLQNNELINLIGEINNPPVHEDIQVENLLNHLNRIFREINKNSWTNQILKIITDSLHQQSQSMFQEQRANADQQRNDEINELGKRIEGINHLIDNLSRILEISPIDIDEYITIENDLTGLDLSFYTFPNDLELDGVNLTRTNLSNADLSSVYLTGANLSGANLSGANLSGANLSGANLSGASLTGANLSGADLSRTTLNNANLTDAMLNNADLSGANLSSADLSGATLTNANVTDATLNNAILTNVDWTNTNWANANLTNADLNNLFEVNFNVGKLNLLGAAEYLDNKELNSDKDIFYHIGSRNKSHNNEDYFQNLSLDINYEFTPQPLAHNYRQDHSNDTFLYRGRTNQDLYTIRNIYTQPYDQNVQSNLTIIFKNHLINLSSYRIYANNQFAYQGLMRSWQIIAQNHLGDPIEIHTVPYNNQLFEDGSETFTIGNNLNIWIKQISLINTDPNQGEIQNRIALSQLMLFGKVIRLN